jgi:hypothetical protein
LRIIFFLCIISGREAKFVGIAVVLKMNFFFHIRTVTFKRYSKLLDDFFHFCTNAMAFIACLCRNSLGMLLFLDNLHDYLGIIAYTFPDYFSLVGCKMTARVGGSLGF